MDLESRGARCYPDRSKERPLRSSERPQRKEKNTGVFQTTEEKEAAMRRRKVIEQTAPPKEKDSASGDKDVDWLNQVSSNDRRSNSNSD